MSLPPQRKNYKYYKFRSGPNPKLDSGGANLKKQSVDAEDGMDEIEKVLKETENLYPLPQNKKQESKGSKILEFLISKTLRYNR